MVNRNLALDTILQTGWSSPHLSRHRLAIGLSGSVGRRVIRRRVGFLGVLKIFNPESLQGRLEDLHDGMLVVALQDPFARPGLAFAFLKSSQQGAHLRLIEG